MMEVKQLTASVHLRAGKLFVVLAVAWHVLSFGGTLPMWAMRPFISVKVA